MIRRTLALAGVVALAAGFTGLAGPAAADPGIAALPDASINEVAAELDENSSNHNFSGGYIELTNNTGGTYDLNNHLVRACDVAGSFDTVIAFELGDVIPQGDTYLIAGRDFVDPNGGTPDKFFEGEIDGLLQPEGGVELVNGISSVDDVSWGMPSSSSQCAGFVDAGFTPTASQSLNRVDETAWELRTPTPQHSN